VQNKEMPITNHKKEAGGVYKPGSPLYGKQQHRERQSTKRQEALTEPNSNSVVHVTIPPEEQVTSPAHWWSMLFRGTVTHIIDGLYYFFFYFTLTMLFAVIWTKCASLGRTKESHDERRNNGLAWAYGFCSCDHCFGHHAQVCFCSFCCVPLRLADTYSKGPFPLMKSFWTALIIITCLLALEQLTFGLNLLVLCCMAIYFRQQMRKKYGLESGGSTVCMDCLAWFFCPFCSMAQEARQVEFVMPLKGFT